MQAPESPDLQRPRKLKSFPCFLSVVMNTSILPFAVYAANSNDILLKEPEVGTSD